MSNIKLLEHKKIRSQWDAEQEKWYFSVVDVIGVLTDSPNPRNYWNALKTKLKTEGSELSHDMGQLKWEPKMANCVLSGFPIYAERRAGPSSYYSGS